MRGAKPKPTFLKIVSGNPGHRPLNLREPQPTGRLTKAPSGLTTTQKRIWREAVASAPAGLLRRLDSSVLKVWVVAFDLHRRAVRELEAGGMVIEAPNTKLPIQSPYLAIINKQAAIMLKAAAELGFTPSSRSRVEVSPAGETDAFSTFLEQSTAV